MAFVARGDRGVLLAGDSGAIDRRLCCLKAGTYLGDDWVGISRTADGGLTGYSLSARPRWAGAGHTLPAPTNPLFWMPGSQVSILLNVSRPDGRSAAVCAHAAA
jgi:hypothetical protein